MALVIRSGGEDYECRRRISVELLEATRAELGQGSRREAKSLADVARQASVAEGFICAALAPGSATRFRQISPALSMEGLVGFFNAIAERVDMRTGRIRQR